MDFAQHLDRLDLDDQRILDQEIDPESVGERHVVVMDGNGLLPLDAKTGARQRARQNDFIDSFEQPRPKIAVKMIGAVDDHPRNLFPIDDRHG